MILGLKNVDVRCIRSCYITYICEPIGLGLQNDGKNTAN